MNRRFTGVIGLVATGVSIGIGMFGFALGTKVATYDWRRQLPELGKVISRKNAGVSLEAQHWPTDIDLVPAAAEGDSLTVYMGAAGDTKVDLVFEEGRLVALHARD